MRTSVSHPRVTGAGNATERKTIERKASLRRVRFVVGMYWWWESRRELAAQGKKKADGWRQGSNYKIKATEMLKRAEMSQRETNERHKGTVKEKEVGVLLSWCFNTPFTGQGSSPWCVFACVGVCLSFCE